MPSFPRRRESSGRGSSPLRAVGAALRPHWAALLALALLLCVGVGLIDDYGISADDLNERWRGSLAFDYVRGADDALLHFEDRTYGVGFEMLSATAERVFRINDSRAAYLSRYLLTHLLFLAGGLFAYMLALRLMKNRWLAALAMLLFLLHPRLYAASFINSKDAPLASALMIALFLAHRAFKKDTLWAFALAGAGAAFPASIRVFAVMLIPAVLSMRGVDLIPSVATTGRKRVLLSSSVFALAGVLTLYAAWPYGWGDPVGRLLEAVAFTANQPDLSYSSNISLLYVPRWILITSPLFALLLSAIGAGALLAAAAQARQALRGASLRFGLLLVGALAATIAFFALLGPNFAGGWRHVYFLWAPCALLAPFGMRWLIGALGRGRLRTLAYGAAGAGLLTTVIAIGFLHPLQVSSFNFLVDRTAAEHIATQYWLGAKNKSIWRYDGLRRLMDLRPSAPVALHTGDAMLTAMILPESDGNRLTFTNEALADFTLAQGAPDPNEEPLSQWRLYNNSLGFLAERQPTENPYSQVYEAAILSEPVAALAEFDVYLDRGARAVVYVKEPCDGIGPWDKFWLLAVPRSMNGEQEHAWEDQSFHFYGRGAMFDGKCVAEAPLPDYAVAVVRTGKMVSGPGGFADSVETAFPFDGPEVYRAAYEAAASREPIARGRFDVHLIDGDFVYVKEACAYADAHDRFFLHIIPQQASDLPENRRETGFDNLDFDFFLNGATFDAKCAAVVPTPDYPVARVRTGQHVSGEGEIWSATATLADPSRAADDGRE